MAYAYVQKVAPAMATPSATTIPSGNFGASMTAGSKIIVAVFWFGEVTTVTVTDTLGNTYTERGTILTSANEDNCRFFEADNVSTGTNAVTATYAAARSFRAISAEEYTGVGAFDQASGQVQTAPAATTDAVTSTNATPTGASSLQWGFAFRAEFASLPPTAGTGFSSRAVMWVEGRTEDRRLTTTDATAATFTRGGAGIHLVQQLIFTETVEASGWGSLLSNSRNRLVVS